MPIYEYGCWNCDKDYEFNRTIEMRDVAMCPECGNRLVRKLKFKGTVWAPTSTNGGHK